MPANLSPEYLQAEDEFRRAGTVEEKIAALNRMLAVIPKHKGTEKMQAEIKRRLAKLRHEQQQRRKGVHFDPFFVERHGAGQVVVIGAPNVGKSQIVADLTHAPTEVADYPYTTQRPLPGMMEFENVQIQLVDTPPILGVEVEPAFAGMVRRADAALLVCDLGSDDCLEQVDAVLRGLEQRKLRLVGNPTDQRTDLSVAQVQTLLVGNKIDLPGASERWEVLHELYASQFPMLTVSAKKNLGMDELRRMIFRLLNIIRIYAKPPGKKPDFGKPFTLKGGSTIVDFAEAVHRNFPQRLRFARVWGSAEHDGQPVRRDHVLKDGDVVELHV